MSFCPIFNLVGTTPGFAASSALSVTPFSLAILPSVSPLTTTYSVQRPASTGGATITGGLVMAGGTTPARFVSIAGGFVSVDGRRVRVNRRRGIVGRVAGRLLALAALDQHRREAGDAHGEHAEHGEFQARTAFALLLQQRAFGNERVRIIHEFGADSVLSSRRFLLV